MPASHNLLHATGIVALGFAAASACPALAAGQDNAIELGISFNPIGSVTTIGYERRLSPRVAVGLRVGGISYDYWDGSYHEWGSGTGLDATARYYFNGHSTSGPFIGAAIGSWSVDWDWYDATTVRRSGWGNSSLLNIGGTFGWNFMLSSNFYVQPSVTLGTYTGSGKDNTGTQTSGVGAYGGVGIAAGLTF